MPGLRSSAPPVAVAALLCATVSCAQLVTPVGNVNFLSVEQEREVSDQFAGAVAQQQPVIASGPVAAYVSDVGQRLARTLREPDFRYTFRTVSDPSVNAFNIGGGYVYVHSGLLAVAETEGQVASVVAHEIGHQVMRHVAKAISRQQLFQTLATVAVGPNANQWVQLASGLGLTTGQLYFGREAEREADQVMVELLLRAGYDPREALGMFAHLLELDGRQPGRVGEMFSSHPPTQERIENVRREIARRTLPGDLQRDSQRFHEVQRLVRR